MLPEKIVYPLETWVKEVSECILYQEIYRDFSVTADLMSAIYSIELTDEEHIMLEYCVGEDYTVVSEVVEIELGE